VRKICTGQGTAAPCALRCGKKNEHRPGLPPVTLTEAAARASHCQAGGARDGRERLQKLGWQGYLGRLGRGSAGADAGRARSWSLRYHEDFVTNEGESALTSPPNARSKQPEAKREGSKLNKQ